MTIILQAGEAVVVSGVRESAAARGADGQHKPFRRQPAAQPRSRHRLRRRRTDERRVYRSGIARFLPTTHILSSTNDRKVGTGQKQKPLRERALR